MAGAIPFELWECATLEQADVTPSSPLLVTMKDPGKVTIKGFQAGDQLVVPQPFTIKATGRGRASGTAYTYSAGSIAEFNVSRGDQLSIAPTALNGNGLTFAVSMERFPSYRPSDYEGC